MLNHSKERLDSLELYPFKKLIAEGVSSTMVAHLNIPAYEKSPKKPTTLSPEVVKDLLRDDLNFKGLIFTDAMNMQGVAKYYKPGDADLQALIAGNDILLFPMDVPNRLAGRFPCSVRCRAAHSHRSEAWSRRLY